MPEISSEIVEEGTSAAKRIRQEADQSLLDYLQQLAADTSIRVTVIRELPKTWEGRNIEGTLDTYEEPISEEEIRELHGGGKYKLNIKTPNSKGSYTYLTSRRLKIAGDPKLDGLITTGNNRKEESTSAVKEALSLSREMVDRAHRRADRAEEFRGRGNQDNTLALVMGELRAARQQSAEKDARLIELISSKPETSSTEILLGKAIEGESARILAMQSRMDSELRTRADMHRSEQDRLHQRYEDIARRQEDAHKREVEMLRQSLDMQLATLKMSYEGQIEGYKREIAHLDRQLTSSQQELAELRTKKDKSLLDSISDMAAMKDAIETFSGNKEEGSTLERVISGIMGSSLAEGVAARIAGGPGATGAVDQTLTVTEVQQPDIPIDRPVQLSDGRVIVRRSDGRVMELRPKQKGPQPTGEPASLRKEDLEQILPFMESAFANETDPAEFVRTARTIAPGVVSGPVQNLLKSQGADAFLAAMTKISPSSPLVAGQRGRNWVRKITAILLE